ncbi:hypothetical protein RUM44_002199 [Polyplax serrata]|uniref:Uncharacterized protein n=1 Tax=Polyplax serrata TaxID=468196 RepID=A0ABR1AM67_POLSC
MQDEDRKRKENVRKDEKKGRVRDQHWVDDVEEIRAVRKINDSFINKFVLLNEERESAQLSMGFFYDYVTDQDFINRTDRRSKYYYLKIVLEKSLEKFSICHANRKQQGVNPEDFPLMVR